MKHSTKSVLGTALGLFALTAAANAATVAHWNFDGGQNNVDIPVDYPPNTIAGPAATFAFNRGSGTTDGEFKSLGNPSPSADLTGSTTTSATWAALDLTVTSLTPGLYTLGLTYEASATGSGPNDGFASQLWTLSLNNSPVES